MDKLNRLLRNVLVSSILWSQTILLMAESDQDVNFQLVPIGASDNNIHGSAWNTPFNKIIQVACHNCYEKVHSPTLADALEHVKAIELDIWDSDYFIVGSGNPGYWYVRHSPATGNNDNNCSTDGDGSLEECLSDINMWSELHSEHFPITIFLDKKQKWSSQKQGRTPRHLYSMLRKVFGSKIYGPRELTAFNLGNQVTPAYINWPTAHELRGKVVVVLNGGSFVVDKLTSLFSYNMSSYNIELDKVNPDLALVNFFAGPYIFNLQEVPSTVNMEWSASFFNAPFNSTDSLPDYDVFSKNRFRGWLFRVWGLDSTSFCELLPTNLNFAAYYDFRSQKCLEFNVWPQQPLFNRQ